MVHAPTPAPAPELVFGLVAPIGVDLDLVTEILSNSLRKMNYSSAILRLTEFMKEIPSRVSLTAEAPFIQSYKDRISYANDVRRILGDSALAALAISAIREFRANAWAHAKAHSPLGVAEPTDASELALKAPEETPLSAQAYIIRQLKRPEEAALLRSVYGPQFVLISVYAKESDRIKRIEVEERRSLGGLLSAEDAHLSAHALVQQDASESQDPHGQNVRDTFPLGDVFIDATSKAAAETTIERFIQLLFGNTQITPTREEYGMYLAKAASLRSSDLSRQVGAAIFAPSGEIISLGCNEVPKAGGGTYWSGDVPDGRDFVIGTDQNRLMKFEVLADLLDRLKRGRLLSDKLLEMSDASTIATELMASADEHGVEGSKLMNLLEFGRIIHAEMSAICDAARKGLAVQGATLYCTTFPCHLCAKHIVASGLQRVIYIEPYPKSYATDLHSDSIDVETVSSNKVSFSSFIGVSPFRYRSLFEKGKRKYNGGLAQRWTKGERRPMIDVYQPSYFESETLIVASLRDKLNELT